MDSAGDESDVSEGSVADDLSGLRLCPFGGFYNRIRVFWGYNRDIIGRGIKGLEYFGGI